MVFFRYCNELQFTALYINLNFLTYHLVVTVKTKFTKEIDNFLFVKVFPAKYVTKSVIFKRLCSKLCVISRHETFWLKEKCRKF